jgi:hypothetical protein
MSILDSPSVVLTTVIEDPFFDEAQMAAAAFLARYSGRTLDAYRYDLRTFFQWPPMPIWPSATLSVRTLSFTGPPWNSETSLRRPSTAGCRRFVASITLLTSTAEWSPTRLSTSVGPRSTSLKAEASTAGSSGRSSTPPSG